MPVSAEERRFLLQQVNRLAQTDLDRLWNEAASRSNADFAALVAEAFPEVVDPYNSMAAQLAATWFELSLPQSTYIAEVAPPIPVEKLLASTRWALGATGNQGLQRLSGTLQRAVLDGARDTTLLNVETTGSRWARHARPDACPFCKLLATREASYRSEADALRVSGRSIDLTAKDRRMRAAGLATTDELLDRRATYSRGSRTGQTKTRQQRGSQALGEKYHDDCHCIAIEVRDGQTYEPPDYAAKWQDDYLKARANAGNGDPKAILSAWRSIDAANTTA